MSPDFSPEISSSRTTGLTLSSKAVTVSDKPVSASAGVTLIYTLPEYCGRSLAEYHMTFTVSTEVTMFPLPSPSEINSAALRPAKRPFILTEASRIMFELSFSLPGDVPTPPSEIDIFSEPSSPSPKAVLELISVVIGSHVRPPSDENSII